MMIECEVSVVSEISKFEEKDLLIISCNQSEKQISYEDEIDNSVTNTHTKKQTVDGEVNEDSASYTQYEKQTVDGEVNEDSASYTQYEKQTADEDSIINTQKEQQSIDEEVKGNSVTNTQNENEDECCEEETVNLDWINEFPPLQSRGIQVSFANYVVEKGINASNWASALKSNKPHCPFGVKANGEKLERSTDKYVASTGRSFNRVNFSDVALNHVEKFMKGRNKNDKFRQGHVKSNAKSTVRKFGTLDDRSLGLNEKSVIVPHLREKFVVKEAKEMHEADFKNEINKDETRKVEETESKGEKLELVEANEAEKRAKRRHKRLRLKERKKVVALATNGCSLDQNSNLKQENATNGESWVDKILEGVQESDPNMEKEDEREQSTSLEQEDELKEMVQNKLEKDDAEMRMLQQEDEKTKEYDKAVDDDADEMLKTIQTLAQLREKKREKNLTKKARKKAKVARNKKMKWISVITFILFTLLGLITSMFYVF